jgi:putative oxidoreductase
MATQSSPVAHFSHGWASSRERAVVRGWFMLLGRILYSVIFVLSSLGQFSSQAIAAAGNHGVPMPEIFVPASGVIALAGGLSLVAGYHAKIGGWLLVLFLVPVTLTMHNFWAISDPTMAQMQQIMFLKNVSMLGAALFFSQVGAGPLSLDASRHSVDRAEGRL